MIQSLIEILRLIIYTSIEFNFVSGCHENIVAVDFYLAAERKAKSVKNYIIFSFLSLYNLILILALLDVIIVKIIWEKCESDPATWYTIMKMEYVFQITLLYYADIVHNL